MDVIKTNHKHFYTYAKRKNRSRSAVGPLVVEGELGGGGKEMAEALMKHYGEVYTVPRLEDVNAVVASLEGPEREHEVSNVLLNEHVLKRRNAESQRKFSTRPRWHTRFTVEEMRGFPGSTAH